MSNNPKTTAIGGIVAAVLAAGAAFCVANPDLLKGGNGVWVMAIAVFIVGGGFAALGIAGKDGDKGGNAPNEKIDEIIPPPPPKE